MPHHRFRFTNTYPGTSALSPTRQLNIPASAYIRPQGQTSTDKSWPIDPKVHSFGTKEKKDRGKQVAKGSERGTWLIEVGNYE